MPDLLKIVGKTQGKAKKDRLLEAAKALRGEYDLRMLIQRDRMWLQDLWFLTYNLIDTAQMSVPPTRSKHFTSRAASIVDTGRRVLARNPLRYHVLMDQLNRSREEREPPRILEKVLHGVLYDIDRQMTKRGELNSRMTTAFHALVRGQWAFKLHLTDQAKTSTGSPIHYRALDPRLVLPTFDDMGTQSPLNYDLVTLSQLLGRYEELIRPVVDQAMKAAPSTDGQTDYSFLYVPLLLMEWSTREEHAVLLDLANLPDEIAQAFGVKPPDHTSNRYVWLEEPFAHGFGISLIQVGNVNGIPAGFASQEAARLYAQSSPLNGIPVLRNADTNNTAKLEFVSPGLVLDMYGNPYQYNQAAQPIDPSGAMVGRSIFATVVHHFPELNEILALYKDAIKNEVRGTWVFRSRDGKMVTLRLGDGSINPLTLQESLEKIDPHIQSPDVLTLLQIINEDISQGALDLRFLLASDFEGSGFLRARMEDASLTALVDYQDGMQAWGTAVADSFVTQYRAGKGKFGKWKVHGREPGMRTKFFVIDIDDEVDEALNGAEPPVIEAKVKIARPIDMAARINMAKTAIDPGNPIMGLITALDLIMEFDDADGVHDEILEDLGKRNPTIQLAQIAAAFRRAGADELADMIMQDNFRSSFQNATQQTKTGTPIGAAAGTNPSSAPPEATAGAR